MLFCTIALLTSKIPSSVSNAYEDCIQRLYNNNNIILLQPIESEAYFDLNSVPSAKPPPIDGRISRHPNINYPRRTFAIR
jgi:hypothetical protein